MKINDQNLIIFVGTFSVNYFNILTMDFVIGKKIRSPQLDE